MFRFRIAKILHIWPFLLGLTLNLIFSITALAEIQKQFLAKYCDCITTETLPGAGQLPVRIFSATGKPLARIPASHFQNCTGIFLEIEFRTQEILGIQIDTLRIPMATLKEGPILFGVGKFIAHAFELKNFNGKTHGTVVFRHLIQFDFLDVFSDDLEELSFITPDQIASRWEHFFSRSIWKSFPLRLQKIGTQWTLRDLQSGLRVTEILGMLAMDPQLRFPSGITAMIAAGMNPNFGCDSKIEEPLQALQYGFLSLAHEGQSAFTSFACRKSK